MDTKKLFDQIYVPAFFSRLRELGLDVVKENSALAAHLAKLTPDDIQRALDTVSERSPTGLHRHGRR
jgi:hypothetical protein